MVSFLLASGRWLLNGEPLANSKQYAPEIVFLHPFDRPERI